MTTSDEETTQRSVQELLKLDTYQGMSDDEIQSIVDYRSKTSYTQGKADARTAAIDAGYESLKATSETAYQSISDSLAQALNLRAAFATVGASADE